MCRFVAYLGKEVLLSDIIKKPKHSLVRQSYEAKERISPINADGFGVGWYVPEISDEPCLFTSITPAWGNRNLDRISSKTKSGCIFAHVRAATSDLAVTALNCHPFQYKNMLWMHNGQIGEFEKVKHALVKTLRKEYFNLIQGTTDSEILFALFLNALHSNIKNPSDKDIENALIKCVQITVKICAKLKIKEPCVLNLCVTNGQSIFTTRFVNSNKRKPASLYYLDKGALRFTKTTCKAGPLKKDEEKHQAVVASEPITLGRTYWKSVPANTLVSIGSDLEPSLRPIKILKSEFV